MAKKVNQTEESQTPPPNPPNSNEEGADDEDELPGADDEDELPADDIPYTPDDRWVLNDVTYMKRVAVYEKYGLVKATKAELHSFTTRRDRAQLKRTETDKEFWMRVDPNIDAWMLVTGRKRDVFHINSFVQLNRDIVTEVQHTCKAVNVLRKAINVLRKAFNVLTSRCPLNKALQHIERSERAEEEDEQPQVEVPSQSYWTTFKNWGFW